MVIFSTNKKNTGKKKEKIVCTKMMLEKMFAETYMWIWKQSSQLWTLLKQ